MTVLRFPPTPQPVLSIVLVVYTGWPVAVECLHRIVRHTSVPYEVIVVDNLSPDGSGAVLRACTTGAAFLPMERNVGLAAAQNRAIDRARGANICLMNPDVRVGDGWDVPLLDALTREAAGAASPVLVNSDGSLQEAGAVVVRSGHTYPVGPPGVLELAAPIAGTRRVPYASAACLVVRRAAVRAVGGLDERYHRAYFDDVDLCFSLRATGLDVLVEPRSQVVHLRGGTTPAMLSSRLFEINRERFLQKWSATVPGLPQTPEDARKRLAAGGDFPEFVDS